MADAIPFTRGVPSADMLPVDDFRRALADAMEREPTVALSYSTGGHPGLRRWIGERYGVPGERVVCANGSLEAFAFVAAVLLARAPTKRVLVEAPTYDRSILILQRAGAEVVGIPVDGDGIDTDALAAELERGAPAFLYVIPNFQNPSGATMTLERRRRVLELAAQYDVVVVEDDPYGLLRWAGESYPTLYELDDGGRVLTLSSFTKTVAPGLRIGYAVGSDELAAAVGKYAENTYISPCMVSQAGLAAYCQAGYFEPGVERAKAELEARCDAMVEAVNTHFPPEAQMVVPKGGYFLWIDLGPGADTTALGARAAEAGVPFVKGADFFADGGGTTCLRLAFSAVPADRIREGIERLGAVIAAG
jgi:2-aminoadipate transaminase